MKDKEQDIQKLSLEDSQIETLLETYAEKMKDLRFDPLEHPSNKYLTTYERSYGVDIKHAFGLILRIKKLLKKGKREQALLLLGFVQGILWSNAFFKMSEIEYHNTPKSVELKKSRKQRRK